MEKNTSDKPNFKYNIKQKNEFQISIPKYDYDSKNDEIPRFHCNLEIFINKNFAIFIKIDAIIRPNLNILKMYDFYRKNYVESECIIFLNESSQEIIKKNKREIELSFIFFSIMENIKFKVIPDIFDGGKISSFEGCFKNGKCNFKLSLRLDENCYIKNKTNCTIKIGEFKMSFKIKFIYPDFEPFSDHYYLYFGIEGKTNVQNNWKSLERNEKTEIYVTPFNYRNIEILLKKY